MGIDADRHLADDAIESYIMGSLEEDALDEAEQHLLICETCRERMVQWDCYIRAMKAASRHLSETPKRRWNSRVLLPAFIFCALWISTAAVKYGQANHYRPTE